MKTDMASSGEPAPGRQHIRGGKIIVISQSIARATIPLVRALAWILFVIGLLLSAARALPPERTPLAPANVRLVVSIS